MVQRGRLHTHLAHESNVGHFKEEAIYPPHMVIGTSAAELYPALEAMIPAGFNLLDNGAMTHLGSVCSGFAFLPMGDQASSNMSIMRKWGRHYVNHILPTGLRIYYYADTCQIHSHHNSKLALPDLKKHTCKHFSAANLMLLSSVHEQAVRAIEAMLANEAQDWIFDEPPESNFVLRKVLTDLLRLDDKHHDRAGGRTSTLVQDVLAWLDVANGCPFERFIKHHCVSRNGRLCCASVEETVEKYTVTSMNLALGLAERIPAESRWTNVLISMKRTLVRALANNLPSHRFSNFDPSSSSIGGELSVGHGGCFR